MGVAVCDEHSSAAGTILSALSIAGAGSCQRSARTNQTVRMTGSARVVLLDAVDWVELVWPKASFMDDLKWAATYMY